MAPAGTNSGEGHVGCHFYCNVDRVGTEGSKFNGLTRLADGFKFNDLTRLADDTDLSTSVDLQTNAHLAEDPNLLTRGNLQTLLETQMLRPAINNYALQQ